MQLGIREKRFCDFIVVTEWSVCETHRLRSNSMEKRISKAIDISQRILSNRVLSYANSQRINSV
jgi:hypothetical protein